jgi:hypothetical protein
VCVHGNGNSPPSETPFPVLLQVTGGGDDDTASQTSSDVDVSIFDGGNESFAGSPANADDLESWHGTTPRRPVPQVSAVGFLVIFGCWSALGC